MRILTRYLGRDVLAATMVIFVALLGFLAVGLNLRPQRGEELRLAGGVGNTRGGETAASVVERR